MIFGYSKRDVIFGNAETVLAIDPERKRAVIEQGTRVPAPPRGPGA